MRRVIALLLTVILLAPLVTAESGQNESIDLTQTPISAIDTPTVSHDGEQFDLALTLDSTAVDNGTTVAWTWQVCINSGVCLPPESYDLDSSDGTVWTGDMTPVEDHSYVNYRIILNYTQDGANETFPESGWGGKVWSDCWVDGEVTGGDGCESETDSIPAPSIIAAVFILSLAAIIHRRK